MDAKNIEKLVMKAKDDIIKEVHDRLPRKVGVVAVNHFKQNFRDGGWLDGDFRRLQMRKKEKPKVLWKPQFSLEFGKSKSD